MAGSQGPETWYDKVDNYLLCYDFACSYANMFDALVEVVENDEHYGLGNKRYVKDEISMHPGDILGKLNKELQSERKRKPNQLKMKALYTEIGKFLKTGERREQFRKVTETKFCETYQDQCEDTIATIRTYGSKYILLAVLLRYKGLEIFEKKGFEKVKLNDLMDLVIEMIENNDIWLYDIINLRDTLVSKVHSNVDANTLLGLQDALFQELKVKNHYGKVIVPAQDMAVTFKNTDSDETHTNFLDIGKIIFDRFSFIPKIIEINPNKIKKFSHREILCYLMEVKTEKSKNSFYWQTTSMAMHGDLYFISIDFIIPKPKK